MSFSDIVLPSASLVCTPSRDRPATWPFWAPHQRIDDGRVRLARPGGDVLREHRHVLRLGHVARDGDQLLQRRAQLVVGDAGRLALRGDPVLDRRDLALVAPAFFCSDNASFAAARSRRRPGW